MGAPTHQEPPAALVSALSFLLHARALRSIVTSSPEPLGAFGTGLGQGSGGWVAVDTAPFPGGAKGRLLLPIFFLPCEERGRPALPKLLWSTRWPGPDFVFSNSRDR